MGGGKPFGGRFEGRGERPRTRARPPEPPVHAEPPALGASVPVGDQVEATVTRAAPEAPPAPPQKKVYMCYGHPGITREITAENLVLNGPPFCTQCGIRMAEDLTGRL